MIAADIRSAGPQGRPASEVPVHTLTIYLAAPGTPIHKADGSVGVSSAGHAYYAVSNGTQTDGYGFSPIKTGIVGPGRVVKDEQKDYQNPAYARTLEISEEQYRQLRQFGEAVRLKDQTYFDLRYHGASNSCIDFVWKGLEHAGLHRQLKLPGGNSALHKGFEGHLKVLDNIEPLRSIPAPVPGSRHNGEQTHPLPDKRTLIHRLLSEEDTPAFHSPQRWQEQTADAHIEHYRAAMAAGDEAGMSAACHAMAASAPGRQCIDAARQWQVAELQQTPGRDHPLFIQALHQLEALDPQVAGYWDQRSMEQMAGALAQRAQAERLPAIDEIMAVPQGSSLTARWIDEWSVMSVSVDKEAAASQPLQESLQLLEADTQQQAQRQALQLAQLDEMQQRAPGQGFSR